MVTPAVLSLCHLKTAAKYCVVSMSVDAIFSPKCVRIASKTTLFFGLFFVEIDV